MNKDISSVMKERVLSLIRKPAVAQKEKKPVNKAPLARLGFNGTMLFLDLISGITVGFLTSWFYGVLTFLSGFLALMVWEELFTNAHANMSQKWIAIGGGAIAVLSTLGIGVLAGIANVFSLGGLVASTVLEMIMIISLVVMAFTHGLLWGVYYFTDPTHVAEMKRLVNVAYREQQIQGLEEAKADLNQVKAIALQLDEYEKSGDLEALSASYESMRGQSLLNIAPDQSSIVADPKMPFLQKQVSLSPLQSLDEGKS